MIERVYIRASNQQRLDVLRQAFFECGVQRRPPTRTALADERWIALQHTIPTGSAGFGKWVSFRCAWRPLIRLKRSPKTHSATGGFDPSRGRGGARSAPRYLPSSEPLRKHRLRHDSRTSVATRLKGLVDRRQPRRSETEKPAPSRNLT